MNETAETWIITVQLTTDSTDSRVNLLATSAFANMTYAYKFTIKTKRAILKTSVKA
jgi:hypothetical protein